jgi:hypothetical protein
MPPPERHFSFGVLPKPPRSIALSAHPDRVICRKCCKESYNYKWYTVLYAIWLRQDISSYPLLFLNSE